MERSIEGAGEARSVLKEFHAFLNSPSLVPEQYYRRNKVSYALVCYVNNIIALFLSKNYEVIPVFISRAAAHMAENPPSEGSAAYYKLVENYLAQMSFFVSSFTSVPREEIEMFIPAELLTLGKQALPAPSSTSPGEPDA
jgi:hypothetical protein